MNHDVTESKNNGKGKKRCPLKDGRGGPTEHAVNADEQGGG